MNRLDLTKAVKKTLNINQDQAESAVIAVLDGIGECMRSGEPLKLANFGTFTRSWYKGGRARNPKTDQVVHVEGYYRPRFHPSPALKKMVN